MDIYHPSDFCSVTHNVFHVIFVIMWCKYVIFMFIKGKKEWEYYIQETL